MAEPIRIANCSGFYGDRVSAAAEMVEDGPIDVLTGDWLAELTMLILARTRARSGVGYARTFLTQMEQVLGACVERGHQRGLQRRGPRPARLRRGGRRGRPGPGRGAARRLVDGDDLMRRLGDLAAAGHALVDAETGEPLADRPPGVGQRLPRRLRHRRGAGARRRRRRDRARDRRRAGLRAGGLAPRLGPRRLRRPGRRGRRRPRDRVRRAGHRRQLLVLRPRSPGSSAPASRGPRSPRTGRRSIGKHDGTGGEVSVGTVTSQLLYEIGSPAYLGPDVTARFDTIALEAGRRATACASAARAARRRRPRSRSPRTSSAGTASTLTVAITGLDVEAKAAPRRGGVLAGLPAWRRRPSTRVTVRLVPHRQARPGRPTRRRSRSGASRSRTATSARSGAPSPTPSSSSPWLDDPGLLHARRRAGPGRALRRLPPLGGPRRRWCPST